MRQLFVLVFTLFTALTVRAESGSVESISAGFYQITTNDFGDSKYSVFTTKLMGSYLKSEVSFIKVGLTFVSECNGVSTTDGKVPKAEGTCLVVDADGDKFKLNFSRTNTSGSSSSGVQNWVGMTGKYVGVKGTCNYENKSQVYNGSVYGVNPVKCNVTK